MMFKNILDDLNISKNDFFYLLILTVFSILITYTLINFNQALGIYCSDVFIYLSNSLVFAGYESSILYLYLSPVICILTAILFKLGFLSEASLYLVTGIFCILANIGIYVLLKNKFSSLLSLCGAFLFGSFSLTLLWWANGTLDVPAVALSIWTVIFILLAVDNDSKYYMIAIPLFVLAVFTRYTALFLLPLILLYYLSKHDFFTNLDLLIVDRQEFSRKLKSYIKSEEFRNILKSFAIAFMLVVLFSATILAYGSNLSFLTQSSTFASGSKGEVIDNAYTTDTFFYLHDFPNFLYSDYVSFDNVIPVLNGLNPMSFFLIGLFAAGILLSGYKLINAERKGESKYKYLVWILFVVLLVISILSFKINSLITITLILIDLVILFSYFRKIGIDREIYSTDIFMLAWLLVYFIFFTFLNIKVNRYIITVFPAFIYFVIYALNEILDLSGKFEFFEFKKQNLLKIIPILLIVFCIFSAFTFTSTVHYNEDFNKNKVIADYLTEYDSDYMSKDVAVFKQRPYNWFLRMYTIPITDDRLDYLESSNITYYISDGNFNLSNYTMIYQKEGLYLYERIN
ncbi:glycosyltransferase family 39 protein [uncultured Methanobrevibacter sp.]|uniref:glycosyltransferase family 39 protein n=1 Tax=uncultured Methanobrevibacter sp. TaxID=253161 RepID=UPI0025E3E502|nr:glycosyltransferase family 39 protein [uncultured Methanobrevibacter sp.]